MAISASQNRSGGLRPEPLRVSALRAPAAYRKEKVMDDGIIDLNAERNKRAEPDPEFVRHDDYGRPLYHFGLSYEMDGSTWAAKIWAYDFEDAEKRCASMRQSLVVLGQSYATIPG